MAIKQHEQTAPKILVAMDYADDKDALAFIDKVNPTECGLKVGKEMFTRYGPKFVQHLTLKGFNVFLDLKFHDIPNTVAKAVAAAADLGVWMLNVHTSGGSQMMQAARQALQPMGEDAPLLIGVTVLTSTSQQDMSEMGINQPITDRVLQLAGLAKNSGLDGVVCSAQEASSLKTTLGSEFQLVTPGIRPAGDAVGDQHRIMTPEQAIAVGSDFLVIGRPITLAADPAQKLQMINATIAN